MKMKTTTTMSLAGLLLYSLSASALPYSFGYRVEVISALVENADLASALEHTGSTMIIGVKQITPPKGMTYSVTTDTCELTIELVSAAASSSGLFNSSNIKIKNIDKGTCIQN